MSTVTFVTPISSVTSFNLVAPWVLTDAIRLKTRLESHKIVLESMGVTDLAILGKLTISGVVTPSSGLLVPQASGIVARQSTFGNALRFTQQPGSGPRLLERIGGTTAILKAQPFSQMRLYSASTMAAPSSVHPINAAYWAAEWVEIAANTQILLMQPERHLVILANRITFGSDVSIGWEMKDKPRPEKPQKPKAPDAPRQSTDMSGTSGRRGTNGTGGNPSPNGDDGPEIELWTLDMTGTPRVVVRGQDGFKGGDGGDGGDGGRGAKGKDWSPDWTFAYCDNGPGNGGRGGHGGTGGKGGQGGAGGRGGTFSLYAPQAVITRYIGGFSVDATGGRGGEGGAPGLGGSGGQGGSKGSNRTGHWLGPCDVGDYGQNGQRGNHGGIGRSGDKGSDGSEQNQPIRVQAISSDDFTTALNKPAIVTMNPQQAKEGDTVSITGMRFARTDTVWVDNVQCATTVTSDKTITFVMGKVPGGRRQTVQVRQTDGTISNSASLNVLPTLRSAQSNGLRSDTSPPAHFRPSSVVTLTGTGFAQGARVRVLDQYVPDQDVEYVDSNTLRAKLIRPTSTPRNPDGEPVDIQVILADGSASNEISLVLATYRIVVFGDSVQWGQGLQDDLKFSAIVERHVSANNGHIGVYRDVLAHSGAIIGVGKTSPHPALPGEVPAKYPTILEQVASYPGDKGKVDLILLDGGTNDIDIENIVSPVATSDLEHLVRKHCYEDMKTLLHRVTSQYPNAKVIVTGYFPIVSDDSNLVYLAALLVGMGIPLLGLPAGILVGGVLTLAAKQMMIKRSSIFVARTTFEIPKAIQEINATLSGGPRVFFAQPNFLSKNAFMAPDAWLWGVDLPLIPQDGQAIGGVAQQRALNCAASGSLAPLHCNIASIGHPNVAGAKAYAQSITALL